MDIQECLRNVLSELLHWLGSAFQTIWHFLNSDFALALIGTALAAFAGAFGAQKAIEKNKKREDALRELRATNASIMVAFEICNSMLGLKRQHIRDLYESYNQAKGEFERHRNGLKEGTIPPGKQMIFDADLRSINPFSMPTDVLTTQVFEKISPGARAYTLTNTLKRSIDSLNHSIQARNQLIELWRSSPERWDNDMVHFFFGTSESAQLIDQNYPDTIDALKSLTDDCIFFSSRLCEELAEYGESIREALGKGAPKINTPNWSNAEQQNLMPDREQYRDWETMFVSVDQQNGAGGRT